MFGRIVCQSFHERRLWWASSRTALAMGTRADPNASLRQEEHWHSQWHTEYWFKPVASQEIICMNRNNKEPAWYHDVTSYQWLVLAIASLGWVFDAFEGQLYNITRADMLPQLLHVSPDEQAGSSLGRAIPGVFCWEAPWEVGSSVPWADRWGRKPVMALTILCYSIFSGLTALATEVWHVAALRFLVAMGVGGEWRWALRWWLRSSRRERANAPSVIFHATSVGGVWLAASGGLLVGSQWRIAYMVGVFPGAAHTLVRVSLREPESCKKPVEPKPRAWAVIANCWAIRDGADMLLAEPCWQWSGCNVLGCRCRRPRFDDGILKSSPIHMRATKARCLRLCANRRSRHRHVGLWTNQFHFWSTRDVCDVAHHGRDHDRGRLHVAISFSQLRTELCLLPIFGFFAQGIHGRLCTLLSGDVSHTLASTRVQAFVSSHGRFLAAPVLIWLSDYLSEGNGTEKCLCPRSRHSSF